MTLIRPERSRDNRRPRLEATAGLQELGEKDQLAQRGDGGQRIPFDVDAAAQRIDGQSVWQAGGEREQGGLGLTLRVSLRASPKS